jgi:hypothetical protein
MTNFYLLSSRQLSYQGNAYQTVRDVRDGIAKEIGCTKPDLLLFGDSHTLEDGEHLNSIKSRIIVFSKTHLSPRQEKPLPPGREPYERDIRRTPPAYGRPGAAPALPAKRVEPPPIVLVQPNPAGQLPDVGGRGQDDAGYRGCQPPPPTQEGAGGWRRDAGTEAHSRRRRQDATEDWEEIAAVTGEPSQRPRAAS